jgi:hypothetical protein
LPPAGRPPPQPDVKIRNPFMTQHRVDAH